MKQPTTATSRRDLDSGQVARTLVRVFDMIDATPSFNLGSLIPALFAELNQPVISDYREAALRILSPIDRGDDGTSRNPFHNPPHFGKVALGFRALAGLHNRWATGGMVRLSYEDIANGILASLAHDARHDGTSNYVDGKYQPFRLEDISLRQSLVWIGAKGYMTPGLRTSFGLLYATDRSGPNPSPACLVRQAYDYHFNGGKKPRISDPVVAAKIGSFLRDKKWVLLGSLLHDADVLPSLLSEKRYIAESQRLAKEIGNPLSDQSQLFFLKDILGCRMTTEPARVMADAFITKKIQDHRAALG